MQGDVVRSRWRHDFEVPAPLTPGKPTSVDFELLDVLHTFRKGHCLQVRDNVYLNRMISDLAVAFAFLTTLLAAMSLGRAAQSLLYGLQAYDPSDPQIQSVEPHASADGPQLAQSPTGYSGS